MYVWVFRMRDMDGGTEDLLLFENRLDAIGHFKWQVGEDTPWNLEEFAKIADTGNMGDAVRWINMRDDTPQYSFFAEETVPASVENSLLEKAT
jgi:hypothetical protein